MNLHLTNQPGVLVCRMASRTWLLALGALVVLQCAQGAAASYHPVVQ